MVLYYYTDIYCELCQGYKNIDSKCVFFNETLNICIVQCLKILNMQSSLYFSISYGLDAEMSGFCLDYVVDKNVSIIWKMQRR